jgi:hypothetical protein
VYTKDVVILKVAIESDKASEGDQVFFDAVSSEPTPI